MEDDGSLWKTMEAYERRWKLMKAYVSLWQIMAAWDIF